MAELKVGTGGKVYTSVVDQWLDTLPASDSDLFKEFADITPSPIEIWVYAGVMGYKGNFSDLARWVKLKYRKLNRRDILNSEIVALHSDIQELRMAITSGELKGDHGAQRLAALEKELRSHIETSERMNKSTDKRGLILAGADKVMRELTMIFKDDPQMSEPMENAITCRFCQALCRGQQRMSAYLPELQELPELQAANTRGLRLQDTLLKRMPAVADLGVSNVIDEQLAAVGLPSRRWPTSRRPIPFPEAMTSGCRRWPRPRTIKPPKLQNAAAGMSTATTANRCGAKP